MKISLKERTGTLVIFLSFLMIMQSCQVYKRQGVTLKEALASEKRVKIKTTDGGHIKYHKLSRENGQIIGIGGSNKNPKRTPIKAGDVEEIRIEDELGSVVCTVLAIAIPVLIILEVSQNFGI